MVTAIALAGSQPKQPHALPSIKKRDDGDDDDDDENGSREEGARVRPSRPAAGRGGGGRARLRDAKYGLKIRGYVPQMRVKVVQNLTGEGEGSPFTRRVRVRIRTRIKAGCPAPSKGTDDG